MKYVLGDPIVTGPYTIAIVSRQAVAAGRQAFLCSKQPVYVVVRDAGKRAVLDMTGAKVPLEEVRTLCPAVTTV